LEFNRGLNPQKGGNMKKAKPIKASLGFTKSAAKDVLARGNAVLGGVFNDKDDYSTPPVDQTALNSQLNALSAGITEALDGGKKAIAAREHLKEVVSSSLRQLGHYVEENCKNDMTTFLKSGFEAKAMTRTAATPLSEAIRKIVSTTISGQFQVTLMAQPDATSYQLRWAPVGQGGTLGNWTEIPVGNTRPATLLTGLTPGTAYVFQVRAVTNAGYNDWSESITRIAT
jgi:hypothetical protein